MENNKKYLNEESYQKTNKTIKIVGLICIIIGVCLILGGIYLKVTDGYIFGSHDVFEMSTEELKNYANESPSHIFDEQIADTEFTGTGMIYFGYFITWIGIILRLFIGNARKIGAYNMQHQMPLQQEYMENMVPTVEVIAKEVGKGIKEGMKDDTSSDLREELKKELREELKEELKAELKQELKEKGE